MNKNLRDAKKNKNDEFYTQLIDIEKELKHYIKHFENKVIYMNCDDYEKSNFWKYFYDKFDEYKISKIISTCYNSNTLIDNSISYKVEYDGNKITKTELKGDGDFRNNENIEILKQADIVVTNPPFSLFREYVAQLVEYDKKFIVMGNINAITYKNIFPLIKDEKIWLGINANKAVEFKVPDHYKKCTRIDNKGNKYTKVSSITWFTNLDNSKRHEELNLTRRYNDNPSYYKKYDNYNALEVSKTKDIPIDYNGIMGVPLSYLTKHNPDKFEILGSQRWSKSNELLEVYIGNFIPPEKDKKTLINGKETYDRIFIRRKEN